MFAFFNPYELLQNKNHETCLNALKSMYEDEIDFSELIVEIDRSKPLVRSSSTTFECSATAIDVSQWLTCCRLLDSTPCSCLCLKTLSYHWCFSCQLRDEFPSAQINKILFALYYGRESRLSALAILSIESESIEKLDFGDIISDFASSKARQVWLE